MTRATPSITPIHLLFFLSGAAALGYEIVWTRMFALGLGHEIPGVLAVVAAFFGGLAVGSAALDRMISVAERPGRWYGILEMVIGVWGLATTVVIPLANRLAWHWIGPDASTGFHSLIGFILPFLALLPATVAIGATLPAVDRWTAQVSDRNRWIGSLYGANTVGAVAGILLTTRWIAPELGWTGTLILLSLVHVACGAAALWMELPSRTRPLPKASVVAGAIGRRRIHLTLLSAGILGIGFEVTGIRILSQVLQNTVYTFSAVLAVFLVGTSAGAMLYQRYGKDGPPTKLLANLLCALSFSCVLGSVVLTQANRMHGWSLGGIPDGPVAEWSIAALVFLPSTVVMGALFSHLVQSARHPKGGVGRATAVNTLGAMLAPALFGVVLFPMVGSKWTLVVIGAGYLLLLPRYRRKRLLFLAGPAMLALLPAEAWRTLTVPAGGKVLAWHEGMLANVAVVEDANGQRLLRVNNRFQMGGTGAEIMEARQAHVALLLHPNPKRALFLGLGSGTSFGAGLVHPGLIADGVELIPEAIEVMPLFSDSNQGAARHPRGNLHRADARRYVSATDRLYDVIVADLFHPARDGAGALYSLEHYRAVRSRLDENGLFCQWLPLHQLHPDLLKTIVRTFLETFPDTHAYLLDLNIDTPVLGLIGFTGERRFDPRWVEGRLTDPDLAEALKRAGLNSSIRLFGLLTAGPDVLAPFAEEAPLNTDDHPRVLFDAPRLQADAGLGLSPVLAWPPPEPEPLLRMSDNDGDDFVTRLKRYVEARELYLRGLREQEAGNMPSALEAYVGSAKASEDFTAGYAQCLSLASVLITSNPSEARDLLRRLDEAQPSRRIARRLLERMDSQSTGSEQSPPQ